MAAGVPQPFHVADLETLRNLPAATAAEAAGAMAGAVAGAGPSLLQVAARVPQAGFAAFAGRLEGKASREAAWASFAAASLRAAMGPDTTGATVLVQVDRPVPLPGRALTYRDPDLGPISAASATDPAPGDSPGLILRDLTASRVTSCRLGADTAPALNIAAEEDDYVLTLDFAAGQLDAGTAILLLDGFAARLDDPLRHLL